MKAYNSTIKSRRRFISSCAACSACLAVTPSTFFKLSDFSIQNKKFRIKIIYSCPGTELPYGGWPHIGFNFNTEIEKFNSTLEKNFPKFEFKSVMASGPEDGENILLQEKKEGIRGYIVFHMHGRSQVMPTIVKSNKPILYVNYLYGGSGAFLSNIASFIRNKESGIGFVSTSKVTDIIEAVKSFELIEKGSSLDEFVASVTNTRKNLTPPLGNLQYKTDDFNTLSINEWQNYIKTSKILAVKDEKAWIAPPIMGIPIQYLSFTELNNAWKAADKDEAGEIAEKWKNNAKTIVGVSSNELKNSAAMYLGMKSLLKKHNANAIAINCLGGFYGGHIHAYPCLGFYELNNSGLVGACECDINSAATMIAFTGLTGRPGYISDPVVDTSKHQIIYAHCVAPTKMFGTDGLTNPYIIMTHAEDNNGAAIRSIFPTGYLTTTLKINSERKEIVIHQAKAIDNDNDTRACRSKLVAEPLGDIEKLFTMNDHWGWHRVTFYGDLKNSVYKLANTLAWKVIEET